ncbi:MAG: arginine repressor [Candidatus Dormibacteria bacterium]
MIAQAGKRERQAVIVEILWKVPVETQEQLAQELRRRHLEADQATISRDLRELGVARVAGESGRRYLPPQRVADRWARAGHVLSSQMERLEQVGMMVVLRTPVGAAQVVAVAIDALELPEVAGTVAGDDTIFIQARTAAGARSIGRQLEALRRAWPAEDEFPGGHGK